MPVRNHSTISNLKIRDEFASLGAREKFNRVAEKLSNKEVKTILVVDGSQKEVVGAISEQRFLQVCATGIDPLVAECHEHMSTKILRLLEDTPPHAALKLIKSKSPDAVIILTSERKFKGYLSPSDYRQLEPSADLELEPVTDSEQQTPPDIELENIIDHISKELGAGNKGPVIWLEDGAELLLHNEAIEGKIRGEKLTIIIQVSCDQAPKSTISMNFNLGTDENLDRNMVAEESPSGESVVVGRWGPVLQQTIYDILIKYIDKVSSDNGKRIEGFYAKDSGLMVKYASSVKGIHPEVDSR
tara:strand:+ start:1650 stop:2552 length:903 start_codon:yes stop_codon:yes gene_type:complete